MYITADKVDVHSRSYPRNSRRMIAVTAVVTVNTFNTVCCLCTINFIILILYFELCFRSCDLRENSSEQSTNEVKFYKISINIEINMILIVGSDYKHMEIPKTKNQSQKLKKTKNQKKRKTKKPKN